MLYDAYQGGTVAAATPSARRSKAKAAQRVGTMDATARYPVFSESPSRSSSEKSIHRLPLKRELKDQTYEK